LNSRFYNYLFIYPAKDFIRSFSKPKTEDETGSVTDEGDAMNDQTNIKTFTDLLKRGNLPGDDRPVPNWMKIKNDQLEDVSISHNSVDELVALSSGEFNEFAATVNHEMLFAYLCTMSKQEMARFFTYLDDVVKLENGESAREQFERFMQRDESVSISDKAKARATLETPLMIRQSRYIYRKSAEFKAAIAERYFAYDAEDDFKVYEGYLVKTLWGEMKYVPSYFEQILDQYRDQFYDPADEKHRRFAEHLVDRFGYLIYALYKLNFVSQVTEAAPVDCSFAWFVETFMRERGIDISKLEEKDPLTYYVATLYDAIAEQDDDRYLGALIRATATLFEYYPLHREACEYAMAEMMKSVAYKTVSLNNANSFLSFFEALPSKYDHLSYDTIYELKARINGILANEKPQDNKVFDDRGVKSKMILLNYLVDLEDLWRNEADEEEKREGESA
jgi:hypothetical protein